MSFVRWMRRSATLLLIIAALSLVSCGDPSDIGRRARQKGLVLSLSGSSDATALTLKAEHGRKSALSIRIPARAVFASMADPEKTMIVLAPLSFMAPPGRSEFSVPVFSLRHGRPSADPGEAFSVAYELERSADLRKLSIWLGKKDGRARVDLGDPSSSAPVQQAVWHLAEGLGYEEELDFKIDSMILNYLLGNHPESVIVLLPDAGAIQSEAQLSRSIAKLRADGRLMRERLQLASPEEYASSAVRLRSLFEETGALDYRKRVNDLLSAAGFPADY